MKTVIAENLKTEVGSSKALINADSTRDGHRQLSHFFDGFPS